MKRRSWQLQEAKARLSELVRSAREEGPQEISVRGEPAVVVVSAREYRKLAEHKTSFLEFMHNSPLVGVDLKIERDRSAGRDVEL